MKLYGAFQLLRQRFIRRTETGLLLYPASVLESQTLDSAIRNALHIFGSPREDAILPENFAQATIRIQEEVTAIQWISNNPHYAVSLAEKSLQKITGLPVK